MGSAHHRWMVNVITDAGENIGDVLLIAANSHVAEMYRMKLELDGYRVVTVGDVPDSRTHRAGWKPDLMMIDLGDASAARLDELDRLRADPSWANIPLLLLSTDSEAELQRRGVALRPTDYVLRVPVAAGDPRWDS
jgi:CheY-like chemotaxis protein